MHILIKKETDSGKTECIKINNIESVIFFDDVTARTEIFQDDFGQPQTRMPRKPCYEVDNE